MKLPFVARSAYDVLVDERDRLRQQNDGLVAHLTRIQRAEVGLPETPREPRKAPEAMPEALTNYIGGFGSPSVRRAMRMEAFRRHRAGEGWTRIMADAMKPEDEE